MVDRPVGVDQDTRAFSLAGLSSTGSWGSSRASFFCAVCKDAQYKIIKIKYAVTIMVVTLAIESTKASFASWTSACSVARGRGGLGPLIQGV
jgi:hypothetical protein